MNPSDSAETEQVRVRRRPGRGPCRRGRKRKADRKGQHQNPLHGAFLRLLLCRLKSPGSLGTRAGANARRRRRAAAKIFRGMTGRGASGSPAPFAALVPAWLSCGLHWRATLAAAGVHAPACLSRSRLLRDFVPEMKAVQGRVLCRAQRARRKLRLGGKSGKPKGECKCCKSQ